MNNILLIAAFSTVCYAIIQIVDSKMIKKEKPDMKNIMRHSFFTFGSVMCGGFLYEQFNPIISQVGENLEKTGISNVNVAKVFTDNPGF